MKTLVGPWGSISLVGENLSPEDVLNQILAKIGIGQELSEEEAKSVVKEPTNEWDRKEILINMINGVVYEGTIEHRGAKVIYFYNNGAFRWNYVNDKGPGNEFSINDLQTDELVVHTPPKPQNKFQYMFKKDGLFHITEPMTHEEVMVLYGEYKIIRADSVMGASAK